MVPGDAGATAGSAVNDVSLAKSGFDCPGAAVFVDPGVGAELDGETNVANEPMIEGWFGSGGEPVMNC